MEGFKLTQTYILRIHLPLTDLDEMSFFYQLRTTQVLHSMSLEIQTWVKLIYDMTHFFNNYDYKIVLHHSNRSFLTDGEFGCIQFIFSDTLRSEAHVKDSQNEAYWNVVESAEMKLLLTFAEERNALYFLNQTTTATEVQKEDILSSEGHIIYGTEKCLFFPRGKMVEITFPSD